MERWKQHPLFPKIEVSTMGRVRAAASKAIKKLSVRKDGYLVTSTGGARSSIRRVSKMVLETFKGIQPDWRNDGTDLEACHKNGIQSDNRLVNLYWGTRCDQIADQKKHGTHVPPPILKGWDNPSRRHTDEVYVKAMALMKEGKPSRAVAALTGISKSQLLRRYRANG